MKPLNPRSLPDIAQQKAAIRTAIAQQKATTMSHCLLLSPLLEGICFGIKIHRLVQEITKASSVNRLPRDSPQ